MEGEEPFIDCSIGFSIEGEVRNGEGSECSLGFEEGEER